MIKSNNEKQFKIKKVEKYTDEITDIEKKIVNHTCMLGLSALLVLRALMDVSIDEKVSFMNNIFVSAGAGVGSWELKKMIDLLLNKTMLQSKQEDIINEIEEFENKVDDGMSR